MKTKISPTEQNEVTFRSMVERIADPFISIDKKGYCIYANSKAEKIFNKPQGYLIGKKLWKEFSEDSNRTFQKALKKAMASQQTVYQEVCYTFNDRWFENHIYPSADGASVYMRDITEQKKNELNFNKLAKRNALLLNMMQNSFLLTDTDLNVIDVNPAFCKTIGYSREELLKMNVSDFDVQLSPKEIKENFKRVKEGKIIELETKNKKKDGTVIDVEVVLTEVEIDNKVYFASFGHDISERKRAEEQIINEKELSDSIINSLPGIFYSYDKKGNFLRWNKNFEIVSKYDASEIADMKPLDFFSDDEKKLLDEKIKTVFEKGSAEVEAHFLTKNKEKIPYYFNGKRAQIEGKSCLIGMGIDITERNKALDSIRSMEQKILNQKVQEQKKITRAVIKAQETERNRIGYELHDNVNQLLAGIKLHLTMAARKHEKIKELVKYPLELLSNSIDEIRLLTSKNATPLRNINLKYLVELLIDNLHKNTSIKTFLNYSIPDKFADDDLKLNIYRIIQEEINNIIKHAAPSSVAISLETCGNSICLKTSDDGKGFDPGKKRKGIGISSIINRVESFNGKIDIRSSPGNGCDISIEIPYDFK